MGASEKRAEELVTVIHKPTGGAFYVCLSELVKPPVLLGPYMNPSVAAEDAEKIRAFVAAVIRESRGPTLVGLEPPQAPV
jgi:hypothetical protein